LSELVATSTPVDSIHPHSNLLPAQRRVSLSWLGFGLTPYPMPSRFLSVLSVLMLVFVCVREAEGQTAAGDLDTTFVSSASGTINTMAVQTDGKLIIGGAFESVQNQNRGRLTRLGTNGLVEATSTFADPAINGTVTALTMQPDGKIIVVGKFSTVGGASHNRIARLNSNGTVDSAFTVSLGSDAHAVLYTPDGRIWVGGNFGLLRINAITGAVDTPAGSDAISGAVFALALQSDGKVVIAGKFGRVGTTARRNIARIGTDGRVDTTFKADTDNSVDTDGAGTASVASSAFALAVQPDGKVLVGGYFVRINGVARRYFARLNSNGTVDTAFNPRANGAVYATVVDSVGDIVVGGEFTAIGGVARTCIAKLNSSGGATGDFSRGAGQIAGQTRAPWVFSLAQAIGGQIYAGGFFTRIGGGESQRVARLVNSSTFSISTTVLLDEDPNPDANADSDTMDIRLVLGGAAPTFDMLTVQQVTQTGSDPEVRTTLGVATRFQELGASVWKLRLTAQKRAVGDPVRLDFFALQAQNSGGSSAYSFGFTNPLTIIATPKISFALTDSSTVNESDALDDGSTNLPEPDRDMKVDFTVTGTIPFNIVIPITFGSNSGSEATRDQDYSASQQLVVFTPEMNAIGEGGFAADLPEVSFTLLDDELVEGNEVVTITLGDAASANSLPLGTNRVHIVTIPDDDFAPTLITGPSDGLFYEGGSTTMTVTYTTEGTGRVQWYRNNAPIPGATASTLVLSNLKLSHAGEYFARVSNDKLRPAGGRAFTDTSAEPLGVVRQTPSVQGVASGTNVTLTAVAAGPGLTYQWFNGANPVASTASTYTFPAATGNYLCRVSLGPTTLLAGEHRIGVITGAPVFPALGVFQPGRVGIFYEQEIPIDPSSNLTPSFTSATGLPPGLSYDAGSMKVRGVPSKPGTFRVMMQARNSLGAATATRDLVINAIPPTVLGSYSVRFGLGALQNDIGGRADFTLLSNGSVTGHHVIKGKRRAFTGKATGNNSAVYSADILLRPFEGDAAPRLVLNFDVPGPNYVDAVLQHNSGGWTGWGWRQTWSGGTATSRAGRHHYGSTILSGTVPPGSIAGVFKVSASGVVTLSGHLPDATRLTGSAVLGPAGEVLLYRPLYLSRGALLGGDVPPTIYPVGVPPALDGELIWRKHDTTLLTPPTRDYATGFNGVLELTGSSYAAPSPGTRVMNLGSTADNLQIDLSDGGLAAPISVTATVDASNQVQVTAAPNPSDVKLTFNPSTGQFSGSFLTSGRRVSFQGVFWNTATSGSGMGWFMNGTGARESGRVILTPQP
jgi:uncharacterized delta-60 repeat protein